MPAMPTCTNTRTPRDMDRAHVLHPYTDFSSFAPTGSQIIAEPILSAGGVLIAPQGYHARMRAVCDEYGLLYIADEVVTAFGRLGEWFASPAIFDRQPDIIDCAKGITSGYIPLGATLLSGQIYEVISHPQCQGGVFSMGLTYSGHPVAFAAALMNIQILEREGLLANASAMGAYLQQAAKALLERVVTHPIQDSQVAWFVIP